MTWHILSIDFPPDEGGVATWAGSIADALDRAGERVVVHTRAASGVPDRPYPIRRVLGRSWARWGGWWMAAAVAPRLRPGDRLLCTTWPLAVQILPFAERLGVPTTVAWHGSDLTRPPMVSGLDRVRAGARHAPVSRYLGELLGAPFTVVPGPVDLAPPTRRGDALLVVARLTPLKGVDRALRLAHRLGRPVRVVGDGPARPALEALARELGVAATFTGAVPRDAIPWEGAWALALLSIADPAPAPPAHLGWSPPPGGAGQEGLGLVLLEAAARGIPSIGARTGGIPEAASVVIDDIADPLPELPDGEQVRRWLAAHHGPARAVEVLRRLAEGAPDRVS